VVTIFTPTYNRSYLLRRLYDSILAQTSKDFEWLIVDDGSTDGTEDLINSFIGDGKVNIRYLKQANDGKHRAINFGAREAGGELFFIVDSDDQITPDAVEWLESEFDKISGDSKFAGLSGIDITPSGEKAGGGDDFGTIDADNIDIRLKYHVKGDLSEVFRTDIMREFPFPDFEGEKFCPEDLVWNRITANHIIHYCYKPIYICEYMPDGLTAKIMKVRRDSPLASMTYYSELYYKHIPFAQRLKAAINFWRFTPRRYMCKAKEMKMNGVQSWLMFPMGALMRINDSRK
jgi:glycosyltransferase involved in cell wall biosynthesis